MFCLPYNMICRCILTVLLVFALVQIQLSWRRDEKITHKPWLMLWKGDTRDITQHTGTTFKFKAFSRKYGEPLVGYDELKNSFYPRERTEVEIHIVLTLSGPPLSFHRVVLSMNNIPLRTIDIFIPKLGIANNDMVARFALPEKGDMKIHHYFDSIWSDQKPANASITIAFRSGIPNLYDTPWVYK